MKIQLQHIILYPFALVYGLVVAIRNGLFDLEILRSTRFSIPIISVGNLTAGGTGKTPHTEFLLSVLTPMWRTAVLSRGYKRKGKGFVLANENATCDTLGDEPFQMYRKFQEVSVAVDEKRVHGVTQLLKHVPELKVVVLDDAFQHRYIQPGLSILLTDYSNLYSRDLLLPAGRLREWRYGSKRADIVVVTKCPDDLKDIEMRLIEKELKLTESQRLFFSHYLYQEIVPVFPETAPQAWTYRQIYLTQASVLLVAGIVSPGSIVVHLRNFTKTVETLFFEDHHAFHFKDITLIINAFEKMPSENKILLVTEKDAARLVGNPNFPETMKPLTFALPVKVEIMHGQEDLFIQKIKEYVIEDSRSR